MPTPASPDAANEVLGPWWRSPWRFVQAQWRAIDEAHIVQESSDQRARSDRAMALSIVVFALCLTLQRYYGITTTGDALIRRFLPELAQDPTMLKFGARLYWAGFKSISYVAIPVWLIVKVWKESPRDYGFRWHHSKGTYALYAVMILGAMVLAAIASGFPAFVQKYPLFKLANTGPSFFWPWELAYGFQFACLEFFFRGVILFILAKRFGYLAIFIGILPYSMIHFTKPVLETLASIVGGIALGTLSLRTRSIYGGILAHCMIAWCMDICALWQKGQLAQALGL